MPKMKNLIIRVAGEPFGKLTIPNGARVLFNNFSEVYALCLPIASWLIKTR
jgi:hypothetical protein